MGEDAIFTLAKVHVLYGIRRDLGIKKAWVGEWASESQLKPGCSNKQPDFSLVSATENYVNSCSFFFNKFHFLGHRHDLNIKLKIKFPQVCYFKQNLSITS